MNLDIENSLSSCTAQEVKMRTIYRSTQCVRSVIYKQTVKGRDVRIRASDITLDSAVEA